MRAINSPGSGSNTWDEHQTPLLRQWLNAIAFRLRQGKRKPYGSLYAEKAESKDGLFLNGVRLPELRWLKKPLVLSESDQARVDSIIRRYHLADFQRRSGRLRFLEVLTVLDHLEWMDQQAGGIFHTSNEKTCHWLDVGSKNWGYVDALWAFAHHRLSSPALLDLQGVELDAYRQYADGFTRYDYAQSFLNKLPMEKDAHAKSTAQFHAADIREYKPDQAFDLITCFLPFVFADPHFDWGLPKSHFDPLGILLKMLELLNADGTLVLVNQGADEASRQEQLLSSAFDALAPFGYALEVTPLGQLPESFLPYRYSRYGFICRKKIAKAGSHPAGLSERT